MSLLAAPAFVVVAFIGRMQWGAEAYPNPIRQRFGTNAGEERGVQLAVVAPGSIRTGEIGVLEAYVQNTWDAPRSVVLTVAGKGLWRARYPAPIEVSLEPLTTMALSIPFAIEETETPKIRLVTHIAVSGTGGRRRRLWRAPWKAGRLRRAFTPMQAAAIDRESAGGISTPIAVQGPRVDPPALPAASTRVIWPLMTGIPGSLVRE
jgi:hypothetical protein